MSDDERGKCAKCGCNLLFMPEMHPSSKALCSYCKITTLRAENSKLCEKIDDFKSASLLVGHSGDPADIEPEHVEKEICDLRAEIERLKEDEDCGAGPAGCLNMIRKCRTCQVSDIQDVQRAAFGLLMREDLQVSPESWEVYKAIAVLSTSLDAREWLSAIRAHAHKGEG